jgi:CheY-like chemotaxis protein
LPRNVILLVEDDPNDVFLIQRAVTRAELGSELHCVKNADEAIDYLTASGKYRDRGQYPLPVIMLLDLKLPGRSGLEILKWLRQQEGLRRLPVVVLTNSSEAEDINRAFDAGANSYLVKNPDPDGFLDITKTVHLYWTSLNQRPNLTAPNREGV